MTPARDLVVSAPQESSSVSPSASPAPAALQPPRGSLRPAILVCTSKVVSAATRADYEAWLVDGKRLIEEVLRDKDCQGGPGRRRGRATCSTAVQLGALPRTVLRAFARCAGTQDVRRGGEREHVARAAQRRARVRDRRRRVPEARRPGAVAALAAARPRGWSAASASGTTETARRLSKRKMGAW